MRWLSASSLSTGAVYKGLLGVPTGKIPQDSNLISMKAMQWVLLYLSIGYDRRY
jgi:hypothetical protein